LDSVIPQNLPDFRAAMAAENDDDYKAEAAIRVCASVVRSQGYPWFSADYDRGKEICSDQHSTWRPRKSNLFVRA
jgi:hypothetical protein